MEQDLTEDRYRFCTGPRPERFRDHFALVRLFELIAGVLLISVAPPVFANDSVTYPRRPIKLVVPFGAGGGSDTFGRIIQDAIEREGLLSRPLVIVNVPGAGGTIGSRRVKNARPDGYTLLLLHEGMLTAKHAGQATYGPEAFTPIIGTSDATQVISVAAESPFEDLDSLMTEAAKQPKTLVFSANIGAPSHFAGLMLEAQKAEAAFRYTQNGGGAKRFAAIQGGHVDVSAFSIAEFVQFRESGMRALAILGPKRHPEFPDLPTAREQGYDVISQNMQFWWAPLHTPSERVSIIADAVAKAMESPSVAQRLREMKIEPKVVRGKDLLAEIQKRETRIAGVATSEIADLPDFPLISLSCCAGLAIVVLIRSKGKVADRNPLAKQSYRYRRLFLLGGMTIVYVWSLQSRWLSFVPATALYSCLCCLVLADRAKSKQIARAPLGLLLVSSLSFAISFVLHYVFTTVLVVDLP